MRHIQAANRLAPKLHLGAPLSPIRSGGGSGDGGAGAPGWANRPPRALAPRSPSPSSAARRRAGLAAPSWAQRRRASPPTSGAPLPGSASRLGSGSWPHRLANGGQRPTALACGPLHQLLSLGTGDLKKLPASSLSSMACMPDLTMSSGNPKRSSCRRTMRRTPEQQSNRPNGHRNLEKNRGKWRKGSILRASARSSSMRCCKGAMVSISAGNSDEPCASRRMEPFSCGTWASHKFKLALLSVLKLNQGASDLLHSRHHAPQAMGLSAFRLESPQGLLQARTVSSSCGQRNKRPRALSEPCAVIRGTRHLRPFTKDASCKPAQQRTSRTYKQNQMINEVFQVQGLLDRSQTFA